MTHLPSSFNLPADSLTQDPLPPQSLTSVSDDQLSHVTGGGIGSMIGGLFGQKGAQWGGMADQLLGMFKGGGSSSGGSSSGGSSSGGGSSGGDGSSGGGGGGGGGGGFGNIMGMFTKFLGGMGGGGGNPLSSLGSLFGGGGK